MDKKIITEINRTLEIMGVNRTLLTENTIFDELVDMVRPMFTSAAEKFVASKGKNIFIGTVEVSKDLFTKFMKVIDNPSKIVNLSSKEITKLYRILAQDEYFVNAVYQKTMKNYITQNPQYTERQIIERLINENSRNNNDLSRTIESIWPGDEFVRTTLTSKFRQKIKDFETGKFIDEITPVVSKVSEGTIEFALKEYSVLSSKYYYFFLTKWNKSDEELIRLANRELGIIETKLSKPIPEKIHKNLEQLFVILNARKKWNYQDFEVGVKSYIENNSKLKPAELEYVMSLPEYKYVMETQSDASMNVFKKIAKERIKTTIDSIPGLSMIQELFINGKGANWWKLIGNPKRWATYIAWKDTRFPAEAAAQAMSVGTTSHLWGSALSYLLFEVAIAPAIIAYGKVAFANNEVVNTVNENIELIRELCNEGVLKNCEDFDGLENLTPEDYKRAWLASLPFLSMAYKTHNPDDVLPERFILSQFTHIDETVNIISRFLNSTAFGKGPEAEFNKMVNEIIQDQSDVLYQELIKLGLKPDGGNDLKSVLERLKNQTGGNVAPGGETNDGGNVAPGDDDETIPGSE